MKKPLIGNMCLAAMFMALGIVLPFLTGQIPRIGTMLLPMHIPVLLCGFICGWRYGALVGFILPPLRYVMFGMPPIFPTGAAMAFELAAYGLISGLLYSRSRWKCVFALYKALIAAMLGGRLVWALVRIILSGVSGEAFTWKMFVSGAFLTALPGIVLQLILIPAVMVALNRAGLVHFSKKPEDQLQ